VNINWEIKSFEALTNVELYSILSLRAEVFIVEQTCPYLDTDGKDLKSFHLMGYSTTVEEEKKLISYARIVPPGISFEEVSIGRVVSSPTVRGTGAGRALMQKAIEEIYKIYGAVPIHIGAQLYLKHFYESFGFIVTSDEYLEDDILHIEMIKNVDKK
jgi:ElaA protein